MAKKSSTDFNKEARESAHKIWLAGLGALATAEEEGTKLFNNLVEKGETFETRGKKQLEKVFDRFDGAKDKIEEVKGRAESTWDKLGSSFDERVADALKRLGVPSRKEIQKLTKRVEELTVKVDQLRPKASKPRARKTA